MHPSLYLDHKINVVHQTFNRLIKVSRLSYVIRIPALEMDCFTFVIEMFSQGKSHPVLGLNLHAFIKIVIYDKQTSIDEPYNADKS